MRFRFRWPVRALTLALVCIASVAWARSGGSMGGGFRSSSSGSSSSGSSSSGSRSSGGGYRSSSSRYRSSGGSYRASASGQRVALVVFVLIGGGVVVAVAASVVVSFRAKKAKNQALTVVHFDFGVQQIARDIQHKLEELAATVDVTSAEGLRDMLATVALELKRRQEHVEYASIALRPALSRPEAELQFSRWSDDARSKYGREVLRADRMGVHRQQKETATDGIRDEDGQLAVAQYFVVSIVVAAREVSFPSELTNARQLDDVYSRLASMTAAQLEAVEVVWSPASESDAMDRDDMALRYPALAVL